MGSYLGGEWEGGIWVVSGSEGSKQPSRSNESRQPSGELVGARYLSGCPEMQVGGGIKSHKK